MNINDEVKKILLVAARSSIETIFHFKKLPEPDYITHPILKSKSGAFVTLTIDGDLRGCIGYIISREPLYETVCDAAAQAATSDPRFMPISQSELNEVSIEISVLSESFPMKNYEDIELGKHGIILEESGYRALLLPQVPIEHNMDRDKFLSALCQKGGMNSNAWKSKLLKMSLFTATVFSEEELIKRG